MKNVALTVLFLSLCFPSYSAAAEPLSGHLWKEMTLSLKVPYISAFIAGYTIGRIEGNTVGVANTLLWARERACKHSQESCQTISGYSAELDSIDLLHRAQPSFKRTVQYYVNEVDAFYEAFPLCRGEQLVLLMQKFVWIWGEIENKRTSYQEIGAQCGAKQQ